MRGSARTETAACAIAGGGPAGMVLGLLLARAGVDVVVVEKHTDFLRDFRGDTIHPSTLQVLDELGLADAFLELPHEVNPTLGVDIGDGYFRLADFRWLPGRFRYLAILPQWDFLDFLADAAADLPTFRLRMGAEATGVYAEGGRVAGLRYRTDDGAEHTIRAGLTVAADGRGSTLRRSAGLEPRRFGAPMDVLWFRLPKHDTDRSGTAGRLGTGGLMIRIDRGDYWQCAYVIRKGEYAELRDRGVAVFRTDLARLEPFLADRVGELTGWDDVRVLDVQVNRLQRWWRAGFLCIGDAAHAMSPIGGVGINLAIQDAVAAANVLADPLRRGLVTIDHLARVQQRRWPTTVVFQRLQRLAQDRIVMPVLSGRGPARAPRPLRALDRSRLLQAIPARVIGLGIRPEHVRAGRVQLAATGSGSA